MKPPVIFHVPHASTRIPRFVRAGMRLSPQQLNEELLRMTDRYTDELFAVPERLAQQLLYPVSRLVVDPERFLDDDLEPMAQKGMGEPMQAECSSRGLVFGVIISVTLCHKC